MTENKEFKPIEKKDFENPDNLCQCECGNWHHHEYTAMDGDGNNACPACQVSFAHDLVTRLKGLVKKIADPALSQEDFIKQIKLIYCDILSVDLEYLESSGYFDDIDL